MNVTTLAGWENFYVIVGSSAGALIGLQFVVMTLVAERAMPSPETTNAFATPSVIHFGAVLLLSALLLSALALWTGLELVIVCRPRAQCQPGCVGGRYARLGKMTEERAMCNGAGARFRSS